MSLQVRVLAFFILFLISIAGPVAALNGPDAESESGDAAGDGGIKISKKATTVKTSPGGNGPNHSPTGGNQQNAQQSIEMAQEGKPADDEKGDKWVDPATGMAFVWVIGGNYKMGCHDKALFSSCIPDEKPQHDVVLDCFWMGAHEVTQKQWAMIMNDNPSDFDDLGENCPVENVSWHDIQKFIKRLNDKHEGKYRFRLPTECEWEYACRNAGEDQKYPGAKPLDGIAWYLDNSGKHPHPVGRKKPNGLGLYDMAGNVWEWCQDVYAPDAYEFHKKHNPCFTGEGQPYRVIRGGGWYSEKKELRTRNRGYSPPGAKYHDLGFRLVRED